MLNRSAILRDAHARAKAIMAREAKLLPRGRLWSGYRAAFTYELRMAWGTAKELLRQAAVHAALSALEEAEADAEAAPTPRNVAARIGALRAYAETTPLTPYGREQRRTLLAEADDIAQAARCSMIPAFQDHAHVAH